MKTLTRNSPVTVTEGEQPVILGRKLNLGSGGKTDEGWVNYDITPVLRPTVQGDARRLPFREGSFRHVRCWHVLEHIPREYLIECMNEVWRVLALDGEVDIEVPVFPSAKAVADPTHVSFFVSETFDYFHKNEQFEEHRQLYGILPWEITGRERLGMSDILHLTMKKVADV